MGLLLTSTGLPFIGAGGRLVAVAAAGGGGNGGGTEPDTIVSDIATLESTLSSWDADWNGTVPEGKTASDPRVIGLDTDVVGNVAANGFTFPQQVTIRSHNATFSDGDSSIGIEGAVNLTGSTNIRLYLLRIHGGANRVLMGAGTTDCGAERCLLDGHTTTAITGPYSAFSIVEFDGTTRCFLKTNCIRFSGTASILLDGNETDPIVEDNVIEYVSHDAVKCRGATDSLLFRRNWGPRYFHADPADDPHEDFFQLQGTGNSCTNSTFYGNVKMYGDVQLGGSGGAEQGLFFGAGDSANGNDFEQNIIASNNANGIFIDAPSDINTTATFNTMLTIVLGSAVTIKSVETTNDNIAASSDAAGVDGIFVDVGTSGISAQDFLFASGVTPAASAMIGAYLPAAAERWHWDDPDPTGAYLRAKEIFNDGLHPGNTGWPVAGDWTLRWNNDAGVSSTHTGTYDSDGNNV